MRHVRTALLLAAASTASAQICESTPPEELISANALGYAHAGHSVAAAGDLLVVAAYNDDRMSVGAGSVAVYRWQGGGWVEEGDLLPPTPQTGGWFGNGISTDGARVAVGEPYARTPDVKTGAVSVFRYVGGTGWVFEQEIAPPTVVDGDLFGWSVAIDDDTLVVGSPGVDRLGHTDSGLAYAYHFNGSAWVYDGTLTPPASRAAAKQGWSVAVQNGLALTGAPGGYLPSRGAVAPFTLTDEGWVAESVINSTDLTDDQFGWSVAIFGNRAVIGAPSAETNGIDVGRAAMYRRTTAGNWTHFAYMANPTPNAGDQFGYSVAIQGLNVLVGEPGDDANGSNSGTSTAYTYDLVGVQPLGTLTPAAPLARDLFGTSVAISPRAWLVGADSTDAPDTNAGSAYAFTVGCQCLADMNGDGQLNFFDLSSFLFYFNSHEPNADLAPPYGVYNFFDVSAYLGLYNAGCP